MKQRRYLLIPVAFLLINTLKAQQDWVLKLNKDGIRVYTKNYQGSPVKAVKALCRIGASVSTLTSILRDVRNSKEWMYATKSVALLKELSPTEVIYDSEIELPWPVSNRDFIVHQSITQDSVTNTVKITCVNKPDFIARSKGIVRIEQAYSQWLIHPLAGGQLDVEFELRVDPGGNIPAWLVNLFALTGPFHTFQKLREQVKKAEYQ